MMFSKSGLVAVAMLGASTVEAHMKMRQPTPYSDSSLNNSPLAADGSDFPCKLRDNAFVAPSQETIAQIGEVMPLTFTGSATHGGGSCQVSLTTDLKPSKDSKWMVIKSIEGGCPANVDGNMSGGADVPDPFEFNYTIPAGIEPGKYTLAWTWFNRIGNREMYMNCAPITVTGGSSKRDAAPVAEKVEVEKRSANFPAMFVANINGCTTKEGVDIRFPNPGDVVEYDGNPSNLQPAGQAACSGTPAWTVSGGSGSPSTPSTSSSTPAGTGAGVSVSVGATVGATPTAEPEPSSDDPAESAGAPGIFAPTSATVVPAKPTESAAPTSSSSGGGSESGSSSSSSGALTGSCSTEGLWNCIDGSSFQRCANGQWTTAQQMAAGTQCTVGQNANFAISATALKPRMINAMRHRKRAHGGHRHA
ncbi:lytic polysaccharide monooxygenase AA11 family protein [Aspergillus fischeri NRRL 181]|uniref:Endoglucanase n=1 Tax=Neosartorya fischeri (strain ATCC 1020 / DSM 3700 / CBS 544.65 / FGSC A1164 / JCM 1740 / NRRL 181 / WB 181) TaxID=331117 RepID=A1D014_NEOFI|nr:conserved hypothetical protein [Aspergillus fischeri NRRL 181]EAW24334.1 conserved hypothetical protein [Aspergillus fischeri NRRL 181]KAG2026430.1 hypothetical protein GB937_001942 [Aspergillus fischeri]